MEKQLVNLEMVRIKRKEEKREGMEVFMQGGKIWHSVGWKRGLCPAVHADRAIAGTLFCPMFLSV